MSKLNLEVAVQLELFICMAVVRIKNSIYTNSHSLRIDIKDKQ